MVSAASIPLIKVLLVEDDEEDYFLTRELFAEIQGKRFQVDWAKSFKQGREAIKGRPYDVCLVDYRLGPESGLELLQMAIKEGCDAPIIILTGQGEREIDLQAMAAGAADYLVKGRLDAGLLERSIRYAMERKRAARCAAAEQARLAALGEAVGLALTRLDSLEEILERCAKAMARYLNAAVASIWVAEADTADLKLVASAGEARMPEQPCNHPALALHVEILSARKPLLINDLASDPRSPDKEWMKREAIAAYAGYPLVIEERVVGVMSIFARAPLSETTLPEMASVANGIAMCIDRKRSAQALDASEFKYRSVVENIKEIIFQIDTAGKFTLLNPAWTEMTGFATRDTLGRPILDYFHPENREHHWELFRQLIERRCSSCRHEMRFLARDGSFRWVEVYAQPLYQGQSGASGTIRDITERKQAEAEIQKLAAFVRLNPEPVVELGADGNLTYLNPAARDTARSLGLDDPLGILPGDAAAIARDCLRVGQSRLGEELTVHDRKLSWSFFPIITSQVVHCYGRDITERTNLEAQLRHAQKLESIGQLAAGVAHDFNNILTIIQGHADRLLGHYEGDPRAAEPLKLVSAAAKRGSSLTRQLLMFSRKQVMQSKVIDLNAVLGNLTRMLHRLLGDDVTLESDFTGEVPPIEADVGMIDQIIMNLSVNARDAMPKGGRLTISTNEVEIDDAYAQQHPDARAGRFVCLKVADTGCGMDRATLSRIFEPFFTTKEVGKGTGLGLATVYGIVKQHQGWIEVNSEPGAGTTFKVYFPTSNKAVEAASDRPAAGGPVRGGNETILVVEDEPVLRELARMILKDYKYNVLEASTGHEALRVWQKHKANIDLLLTDMVMPEGMTGRELAERLRREKPGLKVIYTSGYSADVMGQENGPRDIKFLQKPYPPPELAQLVRECLDLRQAA